MDKNDTGMRSCQDSQSKLSEVLEENEKLRNENALLKIQNKKALEMAIQAKRTKINNFCTDTLSSSKEIRSGLGVLPPNKENLDPSIASIPLYHSNPSTTDQKPHRMLSSNSRVQNASNKT